MTQKLLNLAKELKKYWKMFNDKYVFIMSNFTLTISFQNYVVLCDIICDSMPMFPQFMSLPLA
jgi:hypothetical protein